MRQKTPADFPKKRKQKQKVSDERSRTHARPARLNFPSNPTVNQFTDHARDLRPTDKSALGLVQPKSWCQLRQPHSDLHRLTSCGVGTLQSWGLDPWRRDLRPSLSAFPKSSVQLDSLNDPWPSRVLGSETSCLTFVLVISPLPTPKSMILSSFQKEDHLTVAWDTQIHHQARDQWTHPISTKHRTVLLDLPSSKSSTLSRSQKWDICETEDFVDSHSCSRSPYSRVLRSGVVVLGTWAVESWCASLPLRRHPRTTARQKAPAATDQASTGSQDNPSSLWPWAGKVHPCQMTQQCGDNLTGWWTDNVSRGWIDNISPSWRRSLTYARNIELTQTDESEHKWLRQIWSKFFQGSWIGCVRSRSTNT